MKRLARLATVVGVAAASVGAVAAPASAAPSGTAAAARPAGQVSCGSRTDWLRIFAGSKTCWANAGHYDVNIPGVYEWCAGNNNGYLNTTVGVQNFKKNTCGVATPAGTTFHVTGITIYN